MTVPPRNTRWLDIIERIGNRLPDPATLFVIATLAVMLLSQLAVTLDWSVNRLQMVNGELIIINETITAQSLLSSDGLWWLISHLVKNFIEFPPLGLVLVAMLGIGLAERTGFIPALLRMAGKGIPVNLLTPAMVFLGIMSSLALDAGYIVLPPLAAALYIACGRSPLAGIAAVFAGVSAGFGANLFITGLDPMLAGLTQTSAAVLDDSYRVAVTANWWFMIASTIVLTLSGWFVTSRLVEPRLDRNNDLLSSGSREMPHDTNESYAILVALTGLLIVLVIILMLSLIPDAPLHGQGEHFPRWVEASVPLLLIVFLTPGILYGVIAGTLTNDKDIARIMGDTLASLGPYIVLAFFAAQFIEAFKYSNLGGMLAVQGGQWLAGVAVSASVVMPLFVLLVLTGNLFIGSMSAKYAFFAPVFVPMFMQLGISPELTQVAYRIGDSVSNVITPLNPYMIIILALVQKYRSGAGLGTVVALMLPYTVVFTLAWLGLLLLWMGFGWPLGPGGKLVYP